MSEQRTALLEWIRTHGHPIDTDPDLHTKLLEEGVLTSLQVMDLLLYLEELRGTPIEARELRPGVFRDAETIARHFLEATP